MLALMVEPLLCMLSLLIRMASTLSDAQVYHKQIVKTATLEVAFGSAGSLQTTQEPLEACSILRQTAIHLLLGVLSTKSS